MNDIVQQLNDLNPMGYYDLVPLCQGHRINLAIDNMGGDSDGQGYAVMVVTPATDPDVNFAGPKLDSGHEGTFPDPTQIAQFLSQNRVVAVFCSADERAYSLADYVRLMADYASDANDE